MPDIAIVFPHQLFESHPAVQECKTVALIESPLFFGTDAHHPIPMHWQKLLLHRASMKQYAKERKAEGKKVLYFEAHAYTSDRDILRELDKKSYKKWHLADPVDYMLSKRVDETAQACGAAVTYYDSPLYINTQTDNHNFFDGRKRWFMADFYSHQRKRLDILVDEHGQPVGGKWSYDEDNRKKVPKKLLADIPDLPSISANAHTKAAADYVRDHYPNVIGVQNDLMYPYSREQAEAWLQQFLVERFDLFGDYEDAIVAGENSLWHSLLTPMLNIGLLSPQYVVDMALAYALEKDVPLNSLEGFIRQIIGWREFMRASYESLGVQMRKGNHWQQKNKLPEGFWDGTTGIPPIDDCIQRILKTGYCHHIERLMVLGGFLFLCEVHPKEIYKWFLSMFVDSYDWVMVPNAYAMSQNSAGGLITTKPYFSGSAYVRKMSHYKTGDWCMVWDGLYWRWIEKNSGDLRSNPRWAMMCAMAVRNQEKNAPKVQAAEEWLAQNVSVLTGSLVE